MKLKKDNAGMLPGETCHVPVCSHCGFEHLAFPTPEGIYQASFCPDCGHELDWGYHVLQENELRNL